MKGFNAAKAALFALLILSLLIVFHILVLAGVVPYDMIWGARIGSEEEMWLMEGISIVVNLIMLAIVIVRYRQIINNRKQVFVAVLVWLVFLYFLLNSAGNIFSGSGLETWIFTPISLLLAILFFRMALWRKDPEENLNEDEQN